MCISTHGFRLLLAFPTSRRGRDKNREGIKESRDFCGSRGCCNFAVVVLVVFAVGRLVGEAAAAATTVTAVSYTHLTLPTKA